ncbi:MAG: hypothetical protein KDK64_08460 [Chlamydiia bacterium]|nr:hypothetical protein [Chlamydiia bacterium]
MELHGLGGPPVGAPPSWGQKYFEALERVAVWVAQNFRAVMDYAFPEPTVVLPEIVVIHPAARIPEEKRPISWDAEKFLEAFEVDNLDHNLMILLQATECQLEEPSAYPKRYIDFLREMQGKVPGFAAAIEEAVDKIHAPDEEKGLYERSDLSAHWIFDAIITLQLRELLPTLKGMEQQPQLEALRDLIPPHIEDNRTENRVRARVWHALCQMQGLDLILGVRLKIYDSKITPPATKYLKSDSLDLALLRRAVLETLAN